MGKYAAVSVVALPIALITGIILIIQIPKASGLKTSVELVFLLSPHSIIFPSGVYVDMSYLNTIRLMY